MVRRVAPTRSRSTRGALVSVGFLASLVDDAELPDPAPSPPTEEES